ncbi:hypothetical protein [Absidia glauca]|uniref:Ndc10 domain-containing protein n=1 Tax=Absidia glauca TaxID=4829 RepID=A0A163MV47_ABSGL|nr:hypothetical protein [Absidia glauca]
MATDIGGSLATRQAGHGLGRGIWTKSQSVNKNDRSFYLARAALDPPIILCKKLVPAIDEWHDRLAANELSPNNKDPIQPTAAANELYR